MKDLPHPQALGVPKFKESPFVRELPGGRLSIVHVLLDPGCDPPVHDIQDLPREFAQRPSVYCPFCGSKGKYALTDKRYYFSHLNGQEDCVLRDLETALHQRAKSLLLKELSKARALGRALVSNITCTRCNKNFHKTMCRSAMWDAEEAERQLPDGLRPDITMLSAQTPAFLIELYATHLVEPEKRSRLEAIGIAGVEIDARHLFDEHGNQLWTCEHSLPLPINVWALERAPRSFNICSNCRKVPNERKIAANLIERMSQADPEAWTSALVAGAITGPWFTGLARRPGATLLELTEKPEALRDESQIPAHEMSAEDLESRIFAGLKTHYGVDAPDYWTTLADLGENVFNPLASRVLELSADISGKTEQIGREVKLLERALKLAERIHNALGLGDSQSRALAWIGFGLLLNSSRFGNTCMKEDRLLTWLGKDIQGLTPELLGGWLEG